MSCMEYRYTLDQKWIDVVKHFSEFATGGMQVSIKTKDNNEYKKILLSNCKHIVAMQGYDDLPFQLKEIVEIYQDEDDLNPQDRGGWDLWDEWEI